MEFEKLSLMRNDLLKMLKEKSYRKGEFKLSSGETSEHYVNCKPVILDSRGLWLTSHLLLKTIEHDAKAVAGLTLGADPLVSGVAMASYGFWNRRDRRFMVDGALIVRKEPKGHGTQAWIEGPVLDKGSKVTVLEDVITTGGSSFFAIEKLRDAGYIVERVACLVDRQEGGQEFLESNGLKLMSLFKLEDLI
jgi:orotate phosphoribosyltransferase